MFMQNLSTAAERQSRNKSSKQKKKKGDEVTRDSPASSNASSSASSYASSSASSGLGADPLAMVALLKQSGKLYRQEDQAIPRDIVMGYLNDMVRRLATSANLEAIVAKHLAEGKPMFVLLVDYQQQVMEDEWRIEKQFGCQYLSALTQIYPSDTLIHNAASRFMFMCMRSYISAMKLLEPLQARPLLGHDFVRPAEGDSNSDSNSDRDKETVTERAEGQHEHEHEPLPKSNFMEFMECCNAMNAMPETKKKLKAYFEEHQAPPAPALEEIRRQVWEMCGVDPEYGDYELTQAPKHYAGMQSVALKINQFYLGQDLAAKEAMMSELEKKAFYDQIPVVMHHMPHLFMFQRMMQQQQQQNHVHGPNCQHNHDHGHGHGHDHGHDHGHSHGHGHDHHQQQQQPQMNPQQMQEFQAMMATEDGKAKVASFSSRMESMRSTAAQQVDGWSSQQRQAFFDKFADTELVAKMNSSATANPMEKLQSFMSMTDEDLESLMVLQTIVQADRSSNSLDVSKLQNKVGDMSVSGSHGHGHGHDHSHSHSHGHDHVHGEQCQHGHDHSHGHGHGHSSAPVPDVASGKSASMDR